MKSFFGDRSSCDLSFFNLVSLYLESLLFIFPMLHVGVSSVKGQPRKKELSNI